MSDHLNAPMLMEKELLRRLQITRGTLLKLRRKGLPHLRVTRRLIRYVYEDVVAWLKEVSPSYRAVLKEEAASAADQEPADRTRQ